MLANIFNNPNSHTISLTEFQNITYIYMYALKQLYEKYGFNYSFIRSIADKLNERTKLFQFWSNSYMKS